MRKFIAIAFIGITCAFFGTSNTEAYGGNDKASIEWEGIDVSTVSNSSAPVYMGAGQYTVYFVHFPTGPITGYVDIYDSSSTVVPETTRQKIRVYNNPVSLSTGAVVDANGVAVMATTKEFKYPIKLYKGFAWFTNNSGGSLTSIGYNKKSNR